MKSKMVIVVVPREGRKLTKEQTIHEVAINSIMALLNIGGEIKTGQLTFKLTDTPSSSGIPMGWFNGDSQFNIEVIRIMNKDDVKTLHYWCKSEGIPSSLGNYNGEESVLVIGPSWDQKIEDIMHRSISSDKFIRPLTTEKKKENTK
ncbi:MAG: hypothetical protein J7L51_02605 [Desulfurococcales archaeon]|nr:hypothetical protein [Desulfurococcales archaeon]